MLNNGRASFQDFMRKGVLYDFITEKMRMKKLVVLSLMCGGLSLCGMAWADTLEMKDGRLLEGTYMGGTQTSMRFQTEGKVQVVPVKDILALTFAEPASSANQQTPLSGKTQTAQRPGQYTITPGVKIPVRMSDTVSIQYNQKDDWFAGTLEQDLVVNGTVIAPKGTPVNGQVVSAAQQGKYGPSLVITLRELNLGTQTVKLATNSYIAQTPQASQNTLELGKATLKVITRDRATPLSIPSRAIVEFETTEPVDVRLSR